ALALRSEFTPGGEQAFISGIPAGTIAIDYGLQPSRRLPLVPVASGFAVNFILYAMLAYAAVSVGAIARTHWRRARGQCAACGHTLLASAHECSECGLRRAA